MKRILITKLASLGDLIHLLPALSDAASAIPGIEFDWVVDKNLQEIPLWHASVRQVFLTNHRVWKKKLTSADTRKEFMHVYRKLKKESYDLIIDAQGNFKSALFSMIATGKRAGWDKNSIPDWGAQTFYHEKYPASKNIHAIERLRILLSSSIGYPLPTTPPKYQINTSKFSPPPIPLPSQYLIFVPIASFSSKLWPESHWKELIELCVQEGKNILLPWGNENEKKRAERLATSPQVTVLPKLTLNEIGYLISRAQALVSVDTGFSHLAAALETPCITLYGPTDPKKTGTIGNNQSWIQSSQDCSCSRKCKIQEENPYCMSQIQPCNVLKDLTKLLSS
jgi:heptosyltransferase-1